MSSAQNAARVAVASRSFSKNPILRAELLARYSRVTFNETGKVLSGLELIAFLKGHEKAITGLEILNDEILRELPDLRIIGKYGVGLDMLDFEALNRHGKRLGWTGGVNRRAVAELTLMFMIACLRKVAQAQVELRQGVFQPSQGLELSGRTVGIVGCGHIGKELVGLLEPFGCRILAHDIRDYADYYRRRSIEAVALDALLGQAEIVTLHVPLDSTTRHLLNRERLRAMKPGAILINAARGGLVDETALREFLVSGHLRAAAFDVFEEEPPTDQKLVGLLNFLATPHIGGSSAEAQLAMGRAAILGLDQALAIEDFIKARAAGTL